MLGGIPCQDCRTAAQWPLVAEQAYHSLKPWFLALYTNPDDVCPYESAEGGYQWIWGGPFEASDVIASAWAEVFTPAFLQRVARRVCDEEDCDMWSGCPPAEPDE